MSEEGGAEAAAAAQAAQNTQTENQKRGFLGRVTDRFRHNAPVSQTEAQQLQSDLEMSRTAMQNNEAPYNQQVDQTMERNPGLNREQAADMLMSQGAMRREGPIITTPEAQTPPAQVQQETLTPQQTYEQNVKTMMERRGVTREVAEDMIMSQDAMRREGPVITPTPQETPAPVLDTQQIQEETPPPKVTAEQIRLEQTGMPPIDVSKLSKYESVTDRKNRLDKQIAFLMNSQNMTEAEATERAISEDRVMRDMASNNQVPERSNLRTIENTQPEVLPMPALNLNRTEVQVPEDDPVSKAAAEKDKKRFTDTFVAHSEDTTYGNVLLKLEGPETKYQDRQRLKVMVNGEPKIRRVANKLEMYDQDKNGYNYVEVIDKSAEGGRKWYRARAVLGTIGDYEEVSNIDVMRIQSYVEPYKKKKNVVEGNFEISQSSTEDAEQPAAA